MTIRGRAALTAAIMVLGLASSVGLAADLPHPFHAAARPAPVIPPGDLPAALPSGGGALAETRSHPGMRIRMPELGVDLPVVEGDGYDAPLYEAAHYPGTAWPGDGGRTVIYAHARPGMFGPLFQARAGDMVEVDRPDGPPLRYQITQYYPSWPVTDTRWLAPSARTELVLITCTTYEYEDPRIVAVAEPR